MVGLIPLDLLNGYAMLCRMRVRDHLRRPKRRPEIHQIRHSYGTS